MSNFCFLGAKERKIDSSLPLAVWFGVFFVFWHSDVLILFFFSCFWCFLLHFFSFGFGWTASSLLPLASRWRFYASCSCFSLWLFMTCFRLHVFFSLLSYSPPSPLLLTRWHFSLFSPFSSSTTPLPVHAPHPSLTLSPTPPPHRQTYPITRTITVKAKLWIKGMISPQWPTPWRGWAPLRLCRPCPAVQAPSPACTTASCSAPAARRPSRGWRWTQRCRFPVYSHNWRLSYSWNYSEGVNVQIEPHCKRQRAAFLCFLRTPWLHQMDPRDLIMAP